LIQFTSIVAGVATRPLLYRHFSHYTDDYCPEMQAVGAAIANGPYARMADSGMNWSRFVRPTRCTA